MATHQLEWHNPKTLTTTNDGPDVKLQEPAFIAHGNAKWYIHFGRQIGSFFF